jgi:Bifunctional DNA primase/polymerase, N-terminal
MAKADPPGLAGALDLRARGLVPVVLRARGEAWEKDGRPVVSTGKEPRFAAFGHRAVHSDEAKLRADYAEYPGSGVGLFLGTLPPARGENEYFGRPGVIDLEVDDPVAAEEPLARIFPGGVPDTLRFESSGPGRWHYLFGIDEQVARRLLAIGISKAVLKGLHRGGDGKDVGDPAYPGLELRFGNLRTTPGGSVTETQSVAPPTPRADGSPRRWVGREVLDFPEELLADLAANSAWAKARAETVARENTPREPADRDTLRGLAPIEKIQAQFRAMGRRLEPGVDGSSFSARCTNPDHPDNNPSMTISVVGQDNLHLRPVGSFRHVVAETVLVCCHSRDCRIQDILSGLGLFPCDLEPDAWYRTHGPRRKPDSRKANFVLMEEPGGIDPAQLLAFSEDYERFELALAHRPEKLAELSEALGVSNLALGALGVAWKEKNWFRASEEDEWSDDGPAWVFPMVDGQGTIINLQRRFEDESIAKRGMRGGRNGLFVPNGWQGRPGRLYCVEGVSDTATLWDLGLVAVGRPSNRSGDFYLARLLRGDGREVVVVGENDRKGPAWPGDPRPFAAKLARRLGRPVGWIVPPEPHKDARAWRSAEEDVAILAALDDLAGRSEVIGPDAQVPSAATPTGDGRPGGFTATLRLRTLPGAEEGGT